jgi:hypothetical protein
MPSAHDDAPLVGVVAVDGNRQRGHIALGQPGGRALLTFCDVGPELHFWSNVSARLDPTAARELAAELILWADRRDGYAEQAAS